MRKFGWIAVLSVLCGCSVNRRANLVPVGHLAASAEGEEGFDQPGAAAAFHRRARFSGEGPIPREQILSAAASAKAMRHYSIAEGRFLEPNQIAPRVNGNIGTWQSIGPGNIGGRVRSLVINPQNPKVMMAGSSVNGGVWTTSDGGQTWTPPTSDIPPNAISSLVMDPQNPNIVYAGAGESFCDANLGCNVDSTLGDGIIKTTDGGASWNLLPAAVSFKVVYKLFFGSAHNLYAGTDNGVWRSTDGGATFTQFANLAGMLCEDLAVRTDITTTETVFASCLNPVPAAGATTLQGAIWRNTDAGGAGQFTQVYTQPLMWTTSLAIAPSQQSTIYAMSWAGSTLMGDGQDGHLLGVFRSTDGGTTWTSQLSGANRINQALLSSRSRVLSDLCFPGTKPTTTGGQGWYGNTLAVDPTNPSVVWAGGVDTFRSDDGGVNFGVASYWDGGVGNVGYLHADHHGFVFPPGYNGTSNQSMYALTDGGVFRTDNSRAATQTGSTAGCTGLNTPVIAWTSLSNAVNGWAATEFTNGAVYPGGAGYFAGAQDNGTSRGAPGAAWVPLTGGDGGFVAVNPQDPNIVYTSYVREVTYRANDGVSFRPIIDIGNNMPAGITEPANNFLFYKHLAMDPNNPKVLYVAGQTLWRSLNGGDAWTAASAALQNSVSAIAIAPGNSNVMYMGDASGNVYSNKSALTANSTTVWTMTTPRANAFISDIQVDPTNAMHVYVAYLTYVDVLHPPGPTGAHYIYVSSDGGVTWAPADGTGSSTFPSFNATSLAIDKNNPATIYAGSDFGVFVSLDGGTTWNKDANPFYLVPISNLVLESGSGVTYLYAFTAGRSAWRTAIPGSGTACTYSVSPASLTFPAAGGTFPLTVTMGQSCSASAQPVGGKALIQSPAAVTATAQNPSPQFFISMAANVSGAAIADSVIVQGKTIAITQAAVPTVTSAVQKNDLQAAPFAIPAVPYAASITTSGYTASTTDPVNTCTNAPTFNTSWWTVVAPQSGEFQIESFSGIVTAYPLNGVSTANELACANGRYAGRNAFALTVPSAGSSVAPLQLLAFDTFSIVSGTTYVIEVSTATAAQTSVDFAVRFIANTLISVKTPKSTLAPGESVQATATVAGPDNQAVRWTISPPIGNISPTGLYTAPATLTGSAQVIITATSALDDADFGSATVLVGGTALAGMSIAGNGVTNSATNLTGPVAPGEIVTIFGAGFGPAALTTLTLTPAGKVATTLGGTQVLFDGVPAPMVYAANGQVSAVVPFGIAQQPMTAMQIKTASGASAPVLLPVADTAPAIFTANSSGAGLAAVINQDGTLNSAQNPAAKGSAIVFYATGGGVMNPVETDGQVNTALASTVQTASVSIGGISAQVAYLGAAPNFVAGALQGNVTVPSASASGPVPLVLTVGQASSPANVTIFVK